MEKLSELASQVEGKLLFEEPMAAHTTWRVGGPADALLLAAGAQDVATALAFAKARKVPVLVVGNGSNLLVRDGGIQGLVIKIGEAMSRWSMVNNVLWAEAGAILAKMARETAKRGLAGLTWAAGIPASLGGAAVMNAGAFGHSFYEHLKAVEIVNEGGLVETVDAAALQHGYRSTSLQVRDVVVTAVSLQLQPGDVDTLTEEVETILRRRREKQPLDYPSAGSVFKNPAGDHAGRLVEAAGLRGLRRGQVQVSPKHGNFIVNLGGGSARDILLLMADVQQKVKATFGYELEPEVCIIGEA